MFLGQTQFVHGRQQCLAQLGCALLDVHREPFVTRPLHQRHDEESHDGEHDERVAQNARGEQAAARCAEGGSDCHAREHGQQRGERHPYRALEEQALAPLAAQYGEGSE